MADHSPPQTAAAKRPRSGSKNRRPPPARRFGASGARPRCPIRASLCRARSRHQQLPAADRPAGERGLRRHRRLLADRPAGRRAGADRPAVRRGDGPRARGAARSAPTSCARRRVPLARSVATEACRRAVNGRRFHRARAATRPGSRSTSSRRGGSAARGARLPPPARARRRPGADLRYRRRLDRIGADRAGAARAAHPRLAIGAVGRGLADRDASGTAGRRGRAARARRYAEMRARVADSFADFVERIARAPRRRRRLLGTSGTVTTLASVHLELPQL